MIAELSWAGLVLGYVGTWMLIGEALHRAGVDRLWTRKLVHVAAANTVWFFAYGGLSLETTLVVCVVIASLALADHGRGWFSGVERLDERNLGTVWFWIAMLLVAAALWDHPRLMVAAVMPMGLGDPLAAVVGTRWGRRPYSVAGHRRTIEGSLAFAVVAFLATAAALLWAPGPPAVGFAAALGVALLIAVLGAGLEAMSLWGADNLLVSGWSAVVLWLLLG